MVRKKIALIVLISLALVACGNTEAAIATGIAQTQQISQLETAAAGPASTSTTVPALEGTAESENTVTTNQDLNMRAGDSTAYGVMTIIPGGETVQVIGINQAGTWYQVLYHEAVGWISVGFTSGDIPANLPIATPSAQPQAAATSTGSQGSDNGDDSFLQLDADDDQSRSVSGQISYPGNDSVDRIIITVQGLGGNQEVEVDIAFQCETGNLDPSNVKISAPGATDNTICNNNWSHQVTGNNQIVVTVRLETNGSNKWTLIANVSN